MKWFINQNNKVQGPFENSEIQSLIQKLGTHSQITFLWTRGMSDWIRADKWTPHLTANNQLERNFASETHLKLDTPVKSEVHSESKITTSAKSFFDPKALPEKFKVQYNFVDQKMMTKDELLNFTLKQDDISKISVFDAATSEWKEIYAITEIAEKLGLSRRKNARVPILAQFIGITQKELKLNSRVVTISTAGIGLTDTFDLNIGDEIRGQITSPHFFSALTIEAEVTYTGTDGYVGLKFNQVNDDALALITEYINKFSDKTSTSI